MRQSGVLAAAGLYALDHMVNRYVNPIIHTWCKDSCFTCDGSLTLQVLPLLFMLFNIGMAI
jgi:hypothetical protein